MFPTPDHAGVDGFFSPVGFGLGEFAVRDRLLEGGIKVGAALSRDLFQRCGDFVYGDVVCGVGVRWRFMMTPCQRERVWGVVGKRNSLS